MKCRQCQSEIASGYYAQDYTLRDCCQTCVEAIEKERERLKRIARWETICPPLYRKTNLEFIPANEEAIARILNWKHGARGLLVLGPTGTGKTRTVHRLLKRLILTDGLKIKAFDCVSFAHQCQSAFMGEDGEGWAKKIIEADVVFLDDLGKARLTDRVEMELFAVVERLVANEVPIIATLNDTGDTLVARMSEGRGQPLIRRLREFCESVPFLPRQGASIGKRPPVGQETDEPASPPAMLLPEENSF